MAGAAVDKGLAIELGHFLGLLQVTGIAGMLGLLVMKSRKTTLRFLAAAHGLVALATGDVTAILFRRHVMTGKTADASVGSVIEGHIKEMGFFRLERDGCFDAFGHSPDTVCPNFSGKKKRNRQQKKVDILHNIPRSETLTPREGLLLQGQAKCL